MKIILISLFVFSFASHADDAIKVKGHYFEGTKKKETFKKGNEIQKFKKKPSQLVDRDLREKAFKEAELISEIEKMDELDRDLFYFKVKENSIPELQKEFPSISIEKIKKLKKI